MSEDSEGRLGLRPGDLGEVLERFALFEACFGSGLDLEALGSEGDLLLMRQPFILGEHPTEEALSSWMRDHGWEPWEPATVLKALRELSWKKGENLATVSGPKT